MGRKKERRSSAGPAEPSGPSGLGALLAAKGLVASEPAPAPEPPEPTAADASDDPTPGLSGQTRAVLRIERKGRGGRTVTVIEQLDAALLPELSRQLRKAMGCGSTVEGDALVVQGDQRGRLAPWLLEQGVRKVVSG